MGVEKKEDLRRFAAAVQTAITVKTAQDKFAVALCVCVAARLRANGVNVDDAGNARLIVEAANQTVGDVVPEFHSAAFASLEWRVADAVDMAVCIVLDAIRSGDATLREAGPNVGS